VFGASVDRRWLQFTLGDHAYFWSTRRSGELDLKNADRVARSVGAFAEAVAISNRGTRAVVSNAGQMYSSSAVPPTGETSSVLEREALTGNARVTDRGLSFAGGNNTLAAAVHRNRES